MAVKHNTKSANAKNAVKAAAPAPLAVVAVSTKSLKLLGTSHLVSAFCAFLGATNVLDSSMNTPNVFLLGYGLI
jgi:hypothetical protein